MPMPTHPAPFTVRQYQSDDHDGWVRCRVLSFLDTQYYDDVRPSRAKLNNPSIDTIATHPDHRNSGVGTGLLQTALEHLANLGIETLDAWTREDAAANRWYQRNGFMKQFRYLHIYLGEDDDPTGFVTPQRLSLDPPSR
jgi:ribosomal protein S18 acetylase RimI-like enzyme